MYSPGLGSARGQAPSVWIAEGRPSALVGVFNWTEQPIRVDIAASAPERIGKNAVDAWSGEREVIPAELDLEPRGSRLWEVPA